MALGMEIGCGLAVGAALRLALRHGACVIAGLMLNACRGGGSTPRRVIGYVSVLSALARFRWPRHALHA